MPKNTINIDLERPCPECGKKGAIVTENGDLCRCMECATKEIERRSNKVGDYIDYGQHRIPVIGVVAVERIDKKGVNIVKGEVKEIFILKVRYGDTKYEAEFDVQDIRDRVFDSLMLAINQREEKQHKLKFDK